MIVRRAGRWVAPGIAGVLLILTAACNNIGGGSTANGAAVKAPDAIATITPANGLAKVRPDSGVAVTASGGVLSEVTVSGAGHAADGTFSPDKKNWQSRWTLRPGTTYTVSA